VEIAVIPFGGQPVAVDPAGQRFERGGDEAARAALRVPAARDQAGGFQHLEMPRDGLLRDRERLGQLVQRRLAARKLGDQRAADDSLSARLRVAGAVLAGLGLLVAGIVWAVVPGLPWGGWSAGSSLILSSVILFALLGWSYRRVAARR